MSACILHFVQEGLALMKSSYLFFALCCIGAALFIAGAGWTFRTISHLEEVSERLELKKQYLIELVALESQIAPYTVARNRFEKLDFQEPAGLSEIVKKSINTEAQPQVREIKREDIFDWVLVRKEVAVEKMPVAEAFKLIRDSENSGFDKGGREGVGYMRPPWRLAVCRIDSLAGSPGWGQAVLVFEALQRKD